MTQDQVFSLLLGPLGLTAGAILLIYLLISERLIPRGRLDEQKQATRDAIGVGQGAVDAMGKLADAVEARNRLDEQRVALERDEAQSSRRPATRRQAT